MAVPTVGWPQLSGQLSLVSDYRYRGESLSGGRPALQAGLDYQHDSGLFAGVFASSVRLDPEVSGLAGRIYAGYARQVGVQSVVDAGVISNLFPAPASGPAYSYTEAFVGVTVDRLAMRAYFSNDYSGAGGRAIYLELNGTHAMSAHVTALAHLGLLSLRQPRSLAFADQSRSIFDAKAGLAVGVAEFSFELALVGSSARRSGCAIGTGHCNGALVLELSRYF